MVMGASMNPPRLSEQFQASRSKIEGTAYYLFYLACDDEAKGKARAEETEKRRTA